LEDDDAVIKLKEQNLVQIPKALSERKKEMAAKYQEAKAIYNSLGGSRKLMRFACIR